MTFRAFYLFLLPFFIYSNSYSQNESPGDMYNFYQKFISDIRSQSCPMSPSCSKYAMQAFREKGFGQGLAMTTDRLMRCGHEHKLYEITVSADDYKLVDPVEDFNIGLTKKEQEFSKNFQTNEQEKDLKFFLYLIDNQLYKEAIIEYHRIKFSDSSLDLTLEYNYYKALMSLEEYEKVIFDYDRLKGTELEVNPYMLIKLSEAWYNLNQPQKAIEILEKEVEWEELSDRRYAFKGFVNAHQEDFSQVKKNYSMISKDYIYKEYVSKNLQTIETMSNLKEKKPVVAGLLGIIPGAGYVYSGHTTTGISSLVLNGLLGYATYTSFKTENYGIGILTGMFSTAFYIGNISGGYKAAKRYNKNQKNNQRKKLMYSFN